MDHNSRRFIDDKAVLIFIDNLQRQSFRPQRNFPGRQLLDLNKIVGFQPGTRLCFLTVDGDLAAADKFLDAGTAEAAHLSGSKITRQKKVQAHPSRSWVNHEFMRR